MSTRFVRRQFLSAMLVGTVSSLIATTTHTVRAEDKKKGKVEIALLHGVKDGANQVPAGYPELKEAPWNTYDHYSVLNVIKLELEENKTITNPLVADWTLDTTMVPADSSGTIKVQLVLRDPQKTQIASGKYTIAKGKHILPVSLPYNNGRLVLALKSV